MSWQLSCPIKEADIMKTSLRVGGACRASFARASSNRLVDLSKLRNRWQQISSDNFGLDGATFTW